MKAFALALACVVMAACGGDAVGPGTLPTLSGVQITTDRATYHPTDTVHVTLTNVTTNHQILYNLCFFALERSLGGSWSEVARFPPSNVSCTIELHVLAPQASIAQPVPMIGDGTPGTYRYRFLDLKEQTDSTSGAAITGTQTTSPFEIS